MNEPSSNKLVPLLALAAALVIPALLPQSAHGMYDPKHGRWLQRDPAGQVQSGSRPQVDPQSQYADGSNLYQYVRSRPTVYVDWLGSQATRPEEPPPPPDWPRGPRSACPCFRNPGDCYWTIDWDQPDGTLLPSGWPLTSKSAIERWAKIRSIADGSLFPALGFVDDSCVEYSYKVSKRAVIKLRSHSKQDMSGCSLHQAVTRRDMTFLCGAPVTGYELVPNDAYPEDHPNRPITMGATRGFAWFFDGPAVGGLDWYPRCVRPPERLYHQAVSSYSWRALIKCRENPQVSLEWGFDAVFHYPNEEELLFASEAEGWVDVSTVGP